MGSALVVAAGIGCVIALQVSIVGRAATRFNVLAVSLVLQVGGLLAGLTWTSIRSGWAEIAALTKLWWWLPLGVAGWVLVAGLGFASSRVGVAATLSVAVASQLTVGLAIDAGSGSHLGIRALIGLLLLVSGTALITTRT